MVNGTCLNWVLIIKEAVGENKTTQGSIEPEAWKDTRCYSKKAYFGAESGQRKCTSCVPHFKRW